MRLLILTTCTVLLFSLRVPAQLDQLYCTLELSADTIMIGQPMFFKYQVRNNGKRPLEIYYDSQGRYWNDIGRDETFEIDCYDEQAQLLEDRIATENLVISCSKFVGFKKVEPADRLEYVHWLEDWVTINEPGTYYVEGHKEIVVKKRKKRRARELTCGRSFVVVPFDSLRLEQHLAHLWKVITNPRTASRYEQEALARIQSERAIPYLQMLIDSSGDYSKTVNGIKGLSKFTANRVAFRSIAKILDYDSSLLPVSPERALPESLMGNIRLFAFSGIAAFPDTLSTPFIRQLEDHPDSQIRMKVLQHFFSRAPQAARPMVERRLNDESERVRKEAGWMYQRLQE